MGGCTAGLISKSLNKISYNLIHEYVLTRNK